jgi:cell division septal protein FtsQ
MSSRPSARRASAPTRRSRSVRRSSAVLSRVRAGAALAMLVAAGAIYGVASSSAFQLTAVDVTGTTFTDQADVQAAIDGVHGSNLFMLKTGPLEAALRNLPTVASAQVTVHLPGTLAVAIKERTAVMVWKVGARRYLAGSDGALFAKLTDATADAGVGLPVVEDRRASSAGLYVGARLDTVDLDAATRLASLVPADVGSGAERLLVWVTDENGFIVRTRPASWTAVFGYYTASLRTPELIPGQVELLKSLLYGREATVDRVILASDTDGTYLPNATPKPSATP